jgi:hypothetical protein
VAQPLSGSAKEIEDPHELRGVPETWRLYEVIGTD